MFILATRFLGVDVDGGDLLLVPKQKIRKMKKKRNERIVVDVQDDVRNVEHIERKRL